MTHDEFESQLAALVRAHDDERDFHALCVLYEAASPEQRDVLRRQVDLRDAWRFPDTTTLADGVPRNAPPGERVRDALVWHAIEGGEDPRDNLCDIVLVYHAAQRLGLDVDALFREVAAIAPEPVAECIATFPQREPEDRALEAFGWRETATGTGGVQYEEFDLWAALEDDSKKDEASDE